jgi:hypothetical protein
MKLNEIPFADIIAHDPCAKILEDERECFGYVNVRCPNDDGQSPHLLYVHNPRPQEGEPASIYCQNPACERLTTLQFVELLGNLPKHLC